MSSFIENTKNMHANLSQSVITPQKYYKLHLLDKRHEKNYINKKNSKRHMKRDWILHKKFIETWRRNWFQVSRSIYKIKKTRETKDEKDKEKPKNRKLFIKGGVNEQEISSKYFNIAKNVVTIFKFVKQVI